MGHLFVEITIFKTLLMNLINDKINLTSYQMYILTQLTLLLSSGIIGIAFILASYLLAMTWI
ncbi:hypothetical protein NIES4072_45250 [Nostoc commune NIES-4072]|uniref:Uncharacterized protein n=1 Tax=Nostoc commune NIES-4072 TaxID=2005467 RepID=A0A2R5FX85_NOSCO|nr:hypothetical protein NIES4070_45580 [Nostoc commune HK-02]GBG20843.1 hypothetical protein NIES4072_45250 [Nostoc commune NIES-4072]